MSIFLCKLYFAEKCFNGYIVLKIHSLYIICIHEIIQLRRIIYGKGAQNQLPLSHHHCQE